MDNGGSQWSHTGVSATHGGTVWLSSHQNLPQSSPTAGGGGGRPDCGLWRRPDVMAQSESVVESLQCCNTNTAWEFTLLGVGGGTETTSSRQHGEQWAVEPGDVRSLLDDVRACRRITGNPSARFEELFQFLFLPLATIIFLLIFTDKNSKPFPWPWMIIPWPDRSLQIKNLHT